MRRSVNFEMSFWCHRLNKNSNKNIVRISALNFFCSFMGASWKLFGLPGDLVSNIINKEAYKNPKKLPGSYKNFQDNLLTIFWLLFWSKQRHQKDILKSDIKSWKWKKSLGEPHIELVKVSFSQKVLKKCQKICILELYLRFISS